MLIALLVWNGIVFVLYGWDKLSAVQGAWRVPEKTLLGAALLGGGVGAALGMRVFRHKTRKGYFRVIVWVGAVITLLLALVAGADALGLVDLLQ